MYGAGYKAWKVKGKTHDLNHDLIFSAHTINCVCHSIRSMFRVLGIYNFGGMVNYILDIFQFINFTFFVSSLVGGFA